MVSHKMLAKLSNIIGRAKALQVFSLGDPFGGLNVILVGDFHQFPPVVASAGTSALYIPSHASKVSALVMLGRKLYEQFDVVVRLTIQVRVTDSVWVDLRRARHITPRHAVGMKRNSMKAHSKTWALRLTLITCSAFDSIQGLRLNINKKYALATKPNKRSRQTT